MGAERSSFCRNRGRSRNRPNDLILFRPRWCAIVLSLVVVTAEAGYSFEAAPSHPDWEPGIEALQRLDWPVAISHLAQVVRNQPDNADAHNALGFAYLSATRASVAIGHFREALRLDPKHRSAHENLGETYVREGNLPKAREQLAALERLCGTACDEYRNLAKAIAARTRSR